MNDDYVRAMEFTLRADMGGTVVEQHPWGRVVRLPEMPLRHDSNYGFVDRPDIAADAAALAEAADAAFEGHVDHRLLLFPDADAAERFADGFGALGWERSDGLTMALAGASTKATDPARVVETDAAALRDVRFATILTYPWSTPEVAAQLLDARDYMEFPARHFAVLDGDVPVGWIELYEGEGLAQVEALHVEPDHRNRGHASALVARAVAEAQAGGAGLIFGHADADDWPHHLYRRLGFEVIGRYVKFLRR